MAVGSGPVKELGGLLVQYDPGDARCTNGFGGAESHATNQTLQINQTDRHIARGQDGQFVSTVARHAQPQRLECLLSRGAQTQSI